MSTKRKKNIYKMIRNCNKLQVLKCHDFFFLLLIENESNLSRRMTAQSTNYFQGYNHSNNTTLVLTKMLKVYFL